LRVVAGGWAEEAPGADAGRAPEQPVAAFPTLPPPKTQTQCGSFFLPRVGPFSSPATVLFLGASRSWVHFLRVFLCVTARTGREGGRVVGRRGGGRGGGGRREPSESRQPHGGAVGEGGVPGRARAQEQQEQGDWPVSRVSLGCRQSSGHLPVRCRSMAAFCEAKTSQSATAVAARFLFFSSLYACCLGTAAWLAPVAGSKLQQLVFAGVLHLAWPVLALMCITFVAATNNGFSFVTCLMCPGWF